MYLSVYLDDLQKGTIYVPIDMSISTNFVPFDMSISTDFVPFDMSKGGKFTAITSIRPGILPMASRGRVRVSSPS